jgi:hypothetical protein
VIWIVCVAQLNVLRSPQKKKKKKKHILELNNSDMWQIDKDDSTVQEVKLDSSLMPENFKVTAFISLCLDFV